MNLGARPATLKIFLNFRVLVGPIPFFAEVEYGVPFPFSHLVGRIFAANDERLRFIPDEVFLQHIDSFVIIAGEFIFVAREELKGT